MNDITSTLGASAQPARFTHFGGRCSPAQRWQSQHWRSVASFMAAGQPLCCLRKLSGLHGGRYHFAMKKLMTKGRSGGIHQMVVTTPPQT